MISQLIPLFCYLLFTFLVIRYHRKLKRREVVFFLLYIFVPLGGEMAQMFTRGIAVVKYLAEHNIHLLSGQFLFPLPQCNLILKLDIHKNKQWICCPKRRPFSGLWKRIPIRN